MNGEANDSMEELMDTDFPDDTGKKHPGLELIECESPTNCSNSNGTNDKQSENGNDSSEEEQDDCVENELTIKQNLTNKTTHPSENDDKVPQENHCYISKKSYQDHTISARTIDKSEESKDDTEHDENPGQTNAHESTASHSQENVLSDAVDTDGNEELSGQEDSESEDENGKDNLNDSDIILIENSPLKQNGKKSSDVQEITSDHEDSAATKTENKKSPADDTSEEKPVLRRSNRSIKRLSYKDGNISNGDNSDVELIAIDDSTMKNKPIVISDTKKLFDMAAKSNNLKSDQTQLVIIDSNSKKDFSAKTYNKAAMSAAIAQNLYQSIAARGTTVTPVPARAPPAPAPAPPPPILPSLTDDMFVVEAPSFIVPYVYEKPSIKPFREFVDILGKQLDEEKAKEQKLLMEQEKEAKEKREKEKQERKERGEEVSESEEEGAAAAAREQKRKDKAAKRARRARAEEDDASWDGESSDESEDIPSDEDLPRAAPRDTLAKLEGVVSGLAADQPAAAAAAKSDNYFDCSLGKLFIDIGSSLVQEHVQADLLKQQTRKLYKEKKSGHNTRETQTAIASLMKNLEFSKENNEPFTFKQKKCTFCSFKTDSSLVMSHHLETPHMKNNLYQCNSCEFSIKSSGEMLVHMEMSHGVRGRLERAPAYHPCPSCPFEDNGKGKLARHMLSCAKKFKPEFNLAPPVEWEPPAKLPKMIKMKNPSFPQNFKNMGMNMNMNMNRQGMSIGIPNNMKARPRIPAPPIRSGYPAAPQGRGVGVVRHNLPTPVPISNYPGQNKIAAGKSQPSLSITPLPRAPQPQSSQAQQAAAKGSFVICEICDGYIKDLEQLRNHMQWIHKVKIHPKMIYNRPPLNCQKCQFRFFTDQGLERHLLGSHGLVTSSMQEAANKGKDAGRCPVCGRVYQWKLLNHVARDHKLTLKPAHLSYKCTVCTATFGMYKQFENHVYSAHRVVAKRVMDKNKAAPPAPKPSDSLLKPMKINDEITIIPQPPKSAATTSKGK